MSTSSDGPKFDPYYKWLGIPRREQPPNHYRLLGIALYEADAKVIEGAAHRQATFVRGCGEKKYSDLAERLVGEITVAGKCLLDPAAKSAYDEELKKQQPRQPVKAPRQSRYDALQVSSIDTGALAEAALPTEPASATTPPPDDSPEFELALEPVAAGNATKPGARARQADVGTSSANLPSGNRRAPLPPMPPLATGAGSKGEAKSRTIIMLVVGVCVLAGGATVGILMWSGSNRNSTVDNPTPVVSEQAPVPAPNNTSPTPAATIPSGQVTSVGATKPLPRTAQPAAATKPSAAAQVAPPAKPASVTGPAAPKAQDPAQDAPGPEAGKPLVFANTTWTWSGGGAAPILVVLEDRGVLRVLNGDQVGNWDETEEGALHVQLSGDIFTMTLSQDRRSMTGRSQKGNTAQATLKGLAAGTLAPPTVVAATKPPAKPADSASPNAATPAPAVVASPDSQDPGDDASSTGVAGVDATRRWVLPFRSIRTFRAAWVKGDDATTVDYDIDTHAVQIDSPGDIGGFQFKKPWREIALTLHAETFVGRLEIQVNTTTLKFGTATALIRKPATVIITYDPQTYKLVASIGTRQIATATVLADDFQSSLTCVLRSDGGKVRMKIIEAKVR